MRGLRESHFPRTMDTIIERSSRKHWINNKAVEFQSTFRTVSILYFGEDPADLFDVEFRKLWGKSWNFWNTKTWEYLVTREF